MPSLLPRRLRTARTAAIDVMEGSGIGPIPQSVTYTAEQQRAAMYARRIGFVRRSYEFTAWQAARCTLLPEKQVGVNEWEPGDPENAAESMVYAALDSLQGVRASQPDLVRAAVFSDDTVGEFFVILDDTRPDLPPRWSVRAPNAVIPKKGGRGRGAEKGYLILDAPGGKPEHGTARWVPARNVYRHWQPSEQFELIATSSLMGILDDLDTYWTLARSVRRTARSQMAAGNLLWTPAEAHAVRAPQNDRVSQLEWEYAQAAAAGVNDVDDMNVASVAPMMFKTPGNAPKPELIEVPGLTAEQLAHLQDARVAVADALPLATSSILADKQGNHWNEWLAAEEDVELIEDRLQRVCASFTDAVLRPTLRTLVDAGVWSGDPDEWRIGYDVDPIRRRPDNSANALQALDRGLIGFDAARRELHFQPEDAPTADEMRLLTALAKLRSGDGTGSVMGLPVAATQAPPAEAVPELPAAPGETPTEMTAALPIIDDRWLLTGH